jgi:protein O-mannosyl-transferase
LFAVALGRRIPALHAAAVVCYVLAVISKEYAVLAPLAAVPVYVIVARPSMKRLAALGTAGAVLVGIAAYALVQRYGEIIGKPFDEYSNVYLSQLAALQPGADTNAYKLSIVNQAYLFFHYGLRWFLPFAEWMSINLRPPFPVTFATFPQILGIPAYLALIVAGAWLVLRHRDWRAIAGMSVLMPALLFATEFVTVWVQDPFVLYRSYLWAIGVPGLAFILLHGSSVRVLLVAALLVGTLLVWQSLDRVFSLATPDRAWSDAIAKLPRDPRSVGRWFPYLNRGVERVDRRQYNLAMQDFDISSQLGDMGAGVYNRGALFAANGEHARALASFDLAEQQGYRVYNLPFQRALSLLAVGRPEEALPQLALARSMDPPSPTRELVLLNLGRTALQVGKPAEAVEALQALIKVDPRNADGRFYLAMGLIARRDYPRALEAIEGLPKDKPSGRAHYARALANFGLGRRDAALEDIDAAIRIGPDTPHLREWQARIKAMK